MYENRVFLSIQSEMDVGIFKSIWKISYRNVVTTDNILRQRQHFRSFFPFLSLVTNDKFQLTLNVRKHVIFVHILKKIFLFNYRIFEIFQNNIIPVLFRNIFNILPASGFKRTLTKLLQHCTNYFKRFQNIRATLSYRYLDHYYVMLQDNKPSTVTPLESFTTVILGVRHPSNYNLLPIKEF